MEIRTARGIRMDIDSKHAKLRPPLLGTALRRLKAVACRANKVYHPLVFLVGE
jgi:hypothetical protein